MYPYHEQQRLREMFDHHVLAKLKTHLLLTLPLLLTQVKSKQVQFVEQTELQSTINLLESKEN